MMFNKTESIVLNIHVPQKTETIITIVFYQSTNKFFYNNNNQNLVYMDQISNNRPFNSTYEAQTLLKLGVPKVRHVSISDTDT
jgi:hypothetical protein